jgi:hypothetical protein
MGERVDVWCRDVGAETAELPEAEVVEDDDDDVGAVRASARRMRERFGVGDRQTATAWNGTCDHPRTVLV